MSKIHPFRPKKWAVWMVIKDLQNYAAWIKIVDREKADPHSEYNKWGMKHNFFYTVYFPIRLPEEDRVLPDSIKRLRVVETLGPVHRYIDEELQFAEYIVPEFNQFYDDNNEPTLAYGIVYRFAFKRLSLKWVISRTIIMGLLTWALIKFPIISTVVEWLKNLI
ncbi:MAG: hypothetical protein GYA51_01730 [Candidatus Methanofastidiosa archaeon]|nr:hypothetical protein [Candidatus Methanofastidiosa archaeon]